MTKLSLPDYILEQKVPKNRILWVQFDGCYHQKEFREGAVVYSLFPALSDFIGLQVEGWERIGPRCQMFQRHIDIRSET